MGRRSGYGMSNAAVRTVAGAWLLLVCVSVRGPALAEGPVLHEYIPDVDPNEATLLVRQAHGQDVQVIYEGELLDAPDLDSSAAVPTMTGRPDDGIGAARAGSRAPSFRPDRKTDLEGELSYHSAFNPVVAPFKRVTSLDRVVVGADGRTPVLTVADPSRGPVALETPDAAAPDDRPRDRFWGEVELSFDGGPVVPLPSVSAQSRILSVRTRPSVDIDIERDGADNYFVVVRGSAPAGLARMAFLTDAPQDYFGMPIPPGSVSAQAARVPPMPPAVRAQGLLFASELGLSPASELRAVVHTLTAHFRAFEESPEPPPDTGAIYLDLARAKRGICRHRTYAFVITAQALGLPARFVMNEAHSFVEVAVSAAAWMRIDLGGAAHGLTAHGAQNRPVYRPVEPDRLPRPPAYVRSYSQLRNNASGLRGPPSAAQQGHWIEPEAGLDANTAARRGQTEGPERGAQRIVEGPAFESQQSQASQASGAPRRALLLTVEQERSNAMRGGELVVSGRITDARGTPRPGLRVEISLAAADRTARLLLGVTVSDADGRYRAALGVPADLPVGDYRLVVVSPGDADYLPAQGQ